MTWTRDMGRVLTEIEVENMLDYLKAKGGEINPDQVRRVVINDALVDTGATLLALPTASIRSLGLDKKYSKRVRSTTDTKEVDFFGPVRLSIQGRECPIDVMEVPDGTPALVGQIPLEFLDFVVDLRSHKLIGNPAHGGEHMFEAY